MPRIRPIATMLFLTAASAWAQPALDSITSDLLAKNLARLVAAGDQNFETIRVGPCDDYKTFMDCRSSIELPGARRTTVRIIHDGPLAGSVMVRVNLYLGEEMAEAQRVFDIYSSFIEKKFSGDSIRESGSDDGLPRFTVWLPRRTELRMLIFRRGDKVETTFSLERR
jgi:hypothetical protein